MPDALDRLKAAIADRYELLHPVGEGAHATIYVARDLRHERDVAVKVLRVEASSDENELRFLREIRVLARLQHPNVVPLFDSGFVGSLLYYVMPYVGGVSLRKRLETEKRLPLAHALDLTRDIGRALACAHKAGIVHRDVKPENILIVDERPLLADFGVASIVHGHGRHSSITRTADGQPGTPAYMSPEQLLGSQCVDQRSDTYALGCVFYEMLCGVHPFGGPKGLALRLTGSPTPLQRYCTDVPPEVNAVLLRALEPDPNKRYGSVEEFTAALERTCRRPVSEKEGHPLALNPPTPIAEPAGPPIGREAEIQAVLQLLDTSRLVTIIGPGGIGKTRLAQHVAKRHADADASNVLFVQLGGVSSPDLIWLAISDAVGGTPSGDSREVRVRVIEVLRRRQALIVLDAFEHLMSYAGVIGSLLDQVPQARVLATSRERINLSTEAVLELGGLSVPVDDGQADIHKHSAVRLFVDRARRALPTYRLDDTNAAAVSRICRLVGGLPLGVEIAASMLRVLDTNDLADELQRSADVLTTHFRDVPPRHRNLRAVFEQSWALLPSAERSALARLSVFARGFTREAASRVTSATLDDLRTLVDKSLLHHGSDNLYYMHDVTKRYANEKLLEMPDAGSLARLHSEYFGHFLQERQDRLAGENQRGTADEIAAAIADVRAGWCFAAEHRDEELLGKYHQSLFLTFKLRAWHREGASELALALRDDDTSLIGARIRAARGALLARTGAVAEARDELRRSLGVVARCGTRDDVLAALRPLAEIAWRTGRYRAAERISRRVVSLCELEGRPREIARSWSLLASTLIMQGRLAEAQLLLKRAADALANLGDTFTQFFALNNLGVALLQGGKPDEAKAVLAQALGLARHFGNDHMIGSALVNLGYGAFVSGELERASSLLGETFSRLRNCAANDAMASALKLRGDIESAFGNYDAARQAFGEALELGVRIRLDQVVMSTLVSVARLFVRTKHPEHAAELLKVVLGSKLSDAESRQQATDLWELVSPAAPPPGLGRGQTPTASVVRALINSDFVEARSLTTTTYERQH